MLRLVLSPRWILWHLLTLGAMVACGRLAAWQWERAGSAMGSAINIGYGLQWPIFALFFGVIWWRFLRMEVCALRAQRATPEPVEEADPGPRPPVPPDACPGPSPFRRSPTRAQAVTDAEDPELAEYNRMLAALAERDGSASDRT